jgi:hypothetical protein
MSAGSLTLKISADINDFSKKLNDMTKSVDKAAQKVADIGKNMTLGITLPAGLAAVALGKMAVENEAVGNKMQRQFGPALSDVNHLLEDMMKIVPETMTELQKMTLQVNDFGRGLGMAAPQAAKLSEAVMKMAADLSSKKMIEFSEALDMVQKGLSGQTRGLKSAGIVIDQAQIKQEAFRLGLLGANRELTPLGTALATYSVMAKKMAQSQGDAAASLGDTGRQLQFAKRDLMEFFDATSNLMIPALRVLARTLTAVIGVLNAMPDWLRQSILAFGGLLAILGPTIYLTAKLAQAVMTLRAAMQLLATTSLLRSGLAMLLKPQLLIAVAAIAVALGIGIALWKKYHKEAKDALDPDALKLPDVKDLMGGVTDMNTQSPLQDFQKKAQAIKTNFDLAVAAGQPLVSQFERIRDLNEEANRLYAKQADKMSDVALAAAQTARETSDIVALLAMASPLVAAKLGLSKDATTRASQISEHMVPDTAIALNVARQTLGDEESLRTREMALRLADAFNATRVAVVNIGERLRNTQRDFDVMKQTLKNSFGSKGAMGDAALGGVKAGLTNIMAAFDPFTLAFVAVGKIFQGFAPVLDKVMGPFIAIGQILATLITPALRLLFIPLKLLGIVVAFLGEMVSRVSAGIASTVGTILAAIGRALNKIPFLRLGAGLESAGNALKSFAASQYAAADQLKRQRKELEALDFDNAANGLNGLAEAADNASESIINAAETFKLNLSKYRARDYDENMPGSYVTPSGMAASTMPVAGGKLSLLPGNTPIAQINVGGKEFVQLTWDMIRNSAIRQFGDAGRIMDIAIITG